MTFTDVSTDEIVKTLRGAASQIERRGHIKRFYTSDEWDSEGRPARVCAIGAMQIASGVRDDTAPAYYAEPSNEDEHTALQHASWVCRRTADALARCVGTASVPNWNDAEERTGEEVITEMRACADRVEQAGDAS